MSHGKKLHGIFSKMISTTQISCDTVLDSILCILLHLLIVRYRIYHLDGALQIEMIKRTAEERSILKAEMKCTI